jgi:hypothetical protein
MAIALPYSEHTEHLAWYQRAVAVFDRAGIAVLDNSTKTA